MCIIKIPKIPKTPPNNASITLSGRVFWIAKRVRRIWIINVNNIRDEAIVDVKEAPILFNPSTYRMVPSNGNREKIKNIYQ